MVLSVCRCALGDKGEDTDNFPAGATNSEIVRYSCQALDLPLNSPLLKMRGWLAIKRSQRTWKNLSIHRRWPDKDLQFCVCEASSFAGHIYSSLHTCLNVLGGGTTAWAMPGLCPSNSFHWEGITLDRVILPPCSKPVSMRVQSNPYFPINLLAHPS